MAGFKIKFCVFLELLCEIVMGDVSHGRQLNLIILHDHVPFIFKVLGIAFSTRLVADVRRQRAKWNRPGQFLLQDRRS